MPYDTRAAIGPGTSGKPAETFCRYPIHHHCHYINFAFKSDRLLGLARVYLNATDPKLASNWDTRTICFTRKKLKSRGTSVKPALFRFSAELETLLKRLPTAGQLFPYLCSSVAESSMQPCVQRRATDADLGGKGVLSQAALVILVENLRPLCGRGVRWRRIVD